MATDPQAQAPGLCTAGPREFPTRAAVLSRASPPPPRHRSQDKGGRCPDDSDGAPRQALIRALCGHRQAGRPWHGRLQTTQCLRLMG